MFLTGSIGGVYAGLSGPDPTKERNPPEQPTPVTFPNHEPREGQRWAAEPPLPNFQLLFAQVFKPTDISEDHVQALNVAVLPPCGIEELLPPAPNGNSYIPPLDLEIDSSSDASEQDAAIVRKRRELEDRIAELRLDNDLAFRTISRTLAQGAKPPRIAHMRRFWEGLESMSQFWDASLDQYYETVGTEETQSSKRQRLESDGADGDTGSHKRTAASEHFGPLLPGDSKNHINSEVNQQLETTLGGAADCMQHENGQSGPVTQPRMRYKGRRTGNGKDMPDQFRNNTVRSFVEGTIWPFRTSVAPPRVMPVVQFGKLNLPVRQTAAVYTLPNDRVKARQGYLHGPILALQVRPDIEFETENKEQDVEKTRLDLMREVGGLLHLAQERRRENQPDVKPGEGKWWTTVPRWGGGPGGEVQNELGNSDIVALVAESTETPKENEVKKGEDARRSRKKQSPAILWKELKCGKGLRDPKTVYEAIGTDPESAYDEIFMISSLNHHVSIVKATVHDKYLECLASGTLPDPLPPDYGWCTPKIQRSQWFDLFEVDQRVQAFRGIWGVMAYLTRFQTP